VADIERGPFSGVGDGRRAVVMGGVGTEAAGASLSFVDLDATANRLARLFRQRGLVVGDHVAFVLENQLMTVPVAWGATYAGLFYTPVNWHLTVEEASYIIDDCSASALITSSHVGDLAEGLADAVPWVEHRFMVDGTRLGYESLEGAIASLPGTPLDEERIEGRYLFYSSGTTGRPKGVEYDMPLAPLDRAPGPAVPVPYELDASSVYLCPAPLYHAAGLGWSLAAQRAGATLVVMERFDAESCLALIERHRVTHAQFVPTMFVRLLRLPPEVRVRYDTSSLRFAIHAAAPCPPAVKHEMIDWWGPILHEYYSGTEGAGTTRCDSKEWLRRPGTVGRAQGCVIHICDEHGVEVPPGTTGTIWFESGRPFSYRNDPAKTGESRHPQGWTTLGDVGYVDDEGWLFLTDRKHFMIISGGVNIYPREIEDALVAHPAVLDVAVVGVPDSEYGERVHAVVQPCTPETAGPPLAEELNAWCRARLAGFKCPRSIEFRPELPRDENGKLYKRLLRDQVWERTGRLS
jgi:acyl-CoA synthetase (AMP-forming)/AMP-acid ligase II